VSAAVAAEHPNREPSIGARHPSALVLVDFDNLFPSAVHESELRHVLMRLIELAAQAAPVETSVSVRLYGGWTASGTLSRRGSEVALVASQADPFPMIIRRNFVRGSVELAQSLRSEPSLVFEDTYRRRNAPPRLRLAASPPDGCVDSDGCPAKILVRFTKGPGRICPADSCSVSAGSAFTVHEQKMVDTMLSCDLLQGAPDPEVAAILVVSDDTDFVPPLLAAAQLCRGTIAVLAPNGTLGASAKRLLTSKGVQVLELEDEDGTA
jgi:uncharacterized LabA/DUF88 family protein